MLAELAIATAAFKTVKEFVSEGKELYEMGDSIFQYFDAKSSLQKEVNKHQGDKSDLEEFMALEQVKKQEDELRELMIYAGRAGMWQDWITFQAQAARRRKEKELEIQREKLRKQKEMKQILEWTLIGSLIVVGFSTLVWIFKTIASV